MTFTILYSDKRTELATGPSYMAVRDEARKRAHVRGVSVKDSNVKLTADHSGVPTDFTVDRTEPRSIVREAFEAGRRAAFADAMAEAQGRANQPLLTLECRARREALDHFAAWCDEVARAAGG